MIIIIALQKEKEYSRILNFVESLKIRNSRKFKHAKITRSTVFCVGIIISTRGMDPFLELS